MDMKTITPEAKGPFHSQPRQVKVGSSALVSVMPIDVKILDQMPTSTQTFIERGFFNLICETLKKYIAGTYPESPDNLR